MRRSRPCCSPSSTTPGSRCWIPSIPTTRYVRLAEHAYNFPGHEQEAIEAIHWLVRDANAFTVIGSDPHASARAVMDALAVAN